MKKKKKNLILLAILTNLYGVSISYSNGIFLLGLFSISIFLLKKFM